MSSLPAAWCGLADDASTLAPRGAAVTDAATAYLARREDWSAELVGSLLVEDTRLAQVPADVPVVAVLSGGAGAIAGVATLAAGRGLRLSGVVAAVRDLDDLQGNVRRLQAAFDAADADGALGDTQLYVELPAAPPSPAWLAAADAVVEAEAHLSFRTGRETSPESLAGWIDAALDRESPYRCSGGLDHAVRRVDHATGAEEHGFLNVLLASRLAFDGGTVTEVAELLADRYANDLVALARTSDLVGARRWLTSFGSSDVDASLHDLVDLGLLETPPVG